ncbi:hypothetical protein G6O69_12065 [Pseudenhygromyxa sp. WMMC2535]|uniref:hypothetical protein n=1 Tax=Pseudenhygromyxa sp. WMMC2535 TaxID=2712867 RepID=UPI0015554231|nr:hypothetical protein [Pseudenhygromyxa sp. WMMC2535]NVB38568.1 hypothetical protein [Pseudenhygromyxa sp. WMMC2535]
MKITAMGMACPLGLRWPNAAAAVRAGLVAFDEIDYVDDDCEALTGAALGRLDELLDRPSYRARATQLLAWAVNEALADVSPAERSRLPVVLALPPTDAGQAQRREEIIDALHSCPVPTHGLRPEMVAVVPSQGASAGFRALEWAQTYLAQSERCLVAAADSLIGGRPLANLARQRRLQTERNPDGVIPGEGAAALLLSRDSSPAIAEIHGLGFGREPGLPSNDIPLRARGVLTAARQALSAAGWDPGSLDLRISDAAGDGYAFKEQALLLARLLREPKPQLPLRLPATCLGDMGLAAGLCGVVLAAESIACHQGPGPRTICFAGNTEGERGALVLTTSNDPRT